MTMILIIGGHGQGKLEYVLNTFRLGKESVGMTLGDYPVIYDLHNIIKNIVESGGDAVAEVLAHTEKHPGTIYICDEVGCGVIPVDESERNWRESVGRCCIALANKAERVERIFCGIPMTLKDEGSRT